MLQKKRVNSDGDTDDDFVSDIEEFASPPVPAREKTGRRAASQKIQYKFDDEEDDDENGFNDSDAEPELFDNKIETSVRQQNVTFADDSDQDEEPSSFNDTPIKKPKQRKLGPILDDDESPLKPKAKKTPPKGKRAAESGGEASKPAKVCFVLFT